MNSVLPSRLAAVAGNLFLLAVGHKYEIIVRRLNYY